MMESGTRLWYGELLVSPSPAEVHQRFVTHLVLFLVDFVKRHDLGEATVSPSTWSSHSLMGRAGRAFHRKITRRNCDTGERARRSGPGDRGCFRIDAEYRSNHQVEASCPVWRGGRFGSLIRKPALSRDTACSPGSLEFVQKPLF